MKRPDISFRWGLMLAAALLLATVFTRVYDLARTPPGEAFDVMWDLSEALRIYRGIRFPLLVGESPEILNRFLLAGWWGLVGPSIFTARLFQAFVSVITVALTYRAAWTLLEGRAWRRLGSLLAMGAMAAITPHLFLSRTPYRAMLTAPVTISALIVMLRASRSTRPRDWALAGGVTVCGVFTYLAGIASLPWLAGFLIHQKFIRAGRRISWRTVGWALLGTIPPLVIWGLIIWIIPDYFLRVGEASPEQAVPLLDQLQTGFTDSVRAFFTTGYFRLLYNTTYSPFFNPALAVFVIAGLLPAIRRWRHADGALLLGGLLAFMMPAVLSENATMPLRLIGMWGLLSVSAGWGLSWLGTLAGHTGPALQKLMVWAALLVVILVGGSLAQTQHAYRSLYADEDLYNPPEDWLGVPHNYAMALHDALHLMIDADQPTYVPLELLENPTSGFVLQAKAYPHVTTWARYGLTELPAGQILYPLRTLFHDKTADSYALQALLLPDEGTIVLLPPDGGRPVIEKPDPDTAQVITTDRGWQIALVQDVPARPLPDQPPTPEFAPEFGDGLRLINWPETVRLEPGAPLTVVLEWQVDKRQDADVFSFVQLIDTSDYRAALSSDHHVWQYIYPSARWQPGDIIPDIHTFIVPDHLAPVRYRWGTGAYVPPKIDRMRISSGMLNPIDDIWLWGSALTSPPSDTPLPDDLVPLDVQFGGPQTDSIDLLGYRLEQGADAWTLDLYWRAERLPQDDYLIFVHAMQGDTFAAQSDGPPNGGQTPTWDWWPGTVIQTTHRLELTHAPDTIYAGLYSYPSMARLPARRDQTLSPDGRILIWTK